jgi:hypothetical protein
MLLPLKGREIAMLLPLQGGGQEMVPLKSLRKQEFSVFKGLKVSWTPVFTGETNRV